MAIVPSKRKRDEREAPPMGKGLTALQRKWVKVEYMIMDEISMISSPLLAQIARKSQIAKNITDGRPFAGINIMFCGEFMQYRPVIGTSLFRELRGDFDTVQGHNLWIQINKVVVLVQQMRQTDHQYVALLTRLRTGTCSPYILATAMSLSDSLLNPLQDTAKRSQRKRTTTRYIFFQLHSIPCRKDDRQFFEKDNAPYIEGIAGRVV